MPYSPLQGEPVAPNPDQGPSVPVLPGPDPRVPTSGDALVAPAEPTSSPDPAVPSCRPGPGRK